jgi:ABC-type uncharacterized transport system permease subunit
MGNELSIERDHQTKVPALAPLLAAGIGCAVLGVLTILVEYSPNFLKPHLNFYTPVGPLSGVSILAVVAYFSSWLFLATVFAKKKVSEVRWLTFTFIFICLGFLFTFPPFYQLFKAGS